jgi:hypothetical protein
MRQLSMIAALSAVVVAGFIGNAAQAQQLVGNVILDAAVPDMPSGVNETGRYARFIMDSRMSDMNFKNRDFEAWKPLDVSSRNETRHFMFGRLQTTADSPIADQDVGRYVRVIEDDRLVRNNIELRDRDFYPYQSPSPYTADAGSAMRTSVLRGLPVGTNRGPVFIAPRGSYLSGSERLRTFWQ